MLHVVIIFMASIIPLFPNTEKLSYLWAFAWVPVSISQLHGGMYSYIYDYWVVWPWLVGWGNVFKVTWLLHLLNGASSYQILHETKSYMVFQFTPTYWVVLSRTISEADNIHISTTYTLSIKQSFICGYSKMYLNISITIILYIDWIWSFMFIYLWPVLYQFPNTEKLSYLWALESQSI